MGAGTATTDPPEITLGHPGARLSLSEDHRLVVDFRPIYLIENTGSVGIRDVVTGARTRDGRERQIGEYGGQLITSGESSEVKVRHTVPPEYL